MDFFRTEPLTSPEAPARIESFRGVLDSLSSNVQRWPTDHISPLESSVRAVRSVFEMVRIPKECSVYIVATPVFWDGKELRAVRTVRLGKVSADKSPEAAVRFMAELVNDLLAKSKSIYIYRVYIHEMDDGWHWSLRYVEGQS